MLVPNDGDCDKWTNKFQVARYIFKGLFKMIYPPKIHETPKIISNNAYRTRLIDREIWKCDVAREEETREEVQVRGNALKTVGKSDEGGN